MASRIVSSFWLTGSASSKRGVGRLARRFDARGRTRDGRLDVGDEFVGVLLSFQAFAGVGQFAAQDVPVADQARRQLGLELGQVLD
jgi:hypothetical protein